MRSSVHNKCNNISSSITPPYQTYNWKIDTEGKTMLMPKFSEPLLVTPSNPQFLLLPRLLIAFSISLSVTWLSSTSCTTKFVTTFSIPLSHLGLFQKLSSRGAHIFFRPLHPQDTHGVRAPRPPGHVSALINPPHYGSNMPSPPGRYPSTSHPSDTLSTKHPPSDRTKKCLRPTHPRIVSGTALTHTIFCFLLEWFVTEFSQILFSGYFEIDHIVQKILLEYFRKCSTILFQYIPHLFWIEYQLCTSFEWFFAGTLFSFFATMFYSFVDIPQIYLLTDQTHMGI